MRDFFNFDGPLYNFINKVGDLIWLNILWLICCIPIVTIGASTTALYFVALKLASGEDGYIAKDFFRSFRQNFKQSTVIWIILLAFGIFISYDLYTIFTVDFNFSSTTLLLILSGLFMITLAYVMIFVYIFPLQCKFVNKIKYTFKNALILSIRHLPLTLIIVASYALAIFCFIKFSFLVPIFIFLGVALIAYGQSFIFNKIFNIYIKKHEHEDAPVSNPDTWTIPEDEDEEV